MLQPRMGTLIYTCWHATPYHYFYYYYPTHSSAVLILPFRPQEGAAAAAYAATGALASLTFGRVKVKYTKECLPVMDRG